MGAHVTMINEVVAVGPSGKNDFSRILLPITLYREKNFILVTGGQSNIKILCNVNMLYNI
jgi:hypothetical protein